MIEKYIDKLVYVSNCYFKKLLRFLIFESLQIFITLCVIKYSFLKRDFLDQGFIFVFKFTATFFSAVSVAIFVLWTYSKVNAIISKYIVKRMAQKELRRTLFIANTLILTLSICFIPLVHFIASLMPGTYLFLTVYFIILLSAKFIGCFTTKVADISADMYGKLNMKLDEDSDQNPYAEIDNAGDLFGDLTATLIDINTAGLLFTMLFFQDCGVYIYKGHILLAMFVGWKLLSNLLLFILRIDNLQALYVLNITLAPLGFLFSNIALSYEQISYIEICKSIVPVAFVYLVILIQQMLFGSAITKRAVDDIKDFRLSMYLYPNVIIVLMSILTIFGFLLASYVGQKSLIFIPLSVTGETVAFVETLKVTLLLSLFMIYFCHTAFDYIGCYADLSSGIIERHQYIDKSERKNILDYLNSVDFFGNTCKSITKNLIVLAMIFLHRVGLPSSRNCSTIIDNLRIVATIPFNDVESLIKVCITMIIVLVTIGYMNVSVRHVIQNLMKSTKHSLGRTFNTTMLSGVVLGVPLLAIECFYFRTLPSYEMILILSMLALSNNIIGSIYDNLKKCSEKYYKNTDLSRDLIKCDLYGDVTKDIISPAIIGYITMQILVANSISLLLHKCC